MTRQRKAKAVYAALTGVPCGSTVFNGCKVIYTPYNLPVPSFDNDGERSMDTWLIDWMCPFCARAYIAKSSRMPDMRDRQLDVLDKLLAELYGQNSEG